MVVYGILYLFGFDYIEDDEVEVMEVKEILILVILKIDDFY